MNWYTFSANNASSAAIHTKRTRFSRLWCASMMFTSSDASSLVRELWWWEHAEYVFGSLVAAACAGEYIASFNKRPWVVTHKDRIEKTSTLVLVAALVLELICVSRANSKSDEVIGKLRDTAEAADTLAQAAVQKSNTALTQSQTAITNAGAAESASDKAQQKADDASGRASKLSGKLAEDEKAEVALKRLLWMIDTKASPRSLNDKFVKALKDKPKGTADIWVFPNDKEAYLFSTSIQNALKGAGWSVPEIVLIPEAEDPRIPKSAPPDVRWGMSLVGDILIFSREQPIAGTNTAAGALFDAFCSGMHGVVTGCEFGVRPQLPPDHFVIMVGQRISRIGSLDDKLNSNPKTNANTPH